MTEYDLIIRGGTVVDGTGSPARAADIGVVDGRVAGVGHISGSGRRVIDADGALVTPGWVDVHTHYDGQATWDSCLAPSSWNGVTTAVMGNCGVGFAPVHDSDHDQLIEIMEGVEDIPGTALHAGLEWDWNSFGEYLDALERRPHDIDFAAYVPHNPLRLFVMGDRGAARQAATEADIAEMGRLARIGIQQGALGFSTGRLVGHKTSRGEHTPAYGAAAQECIGIAALLGSAGGGVLQLVSDFEDLEQEFTIITAMMRQSGMPLSFTVSYRPDDENRVRLHELLAGIERAQADGLPLVGQVATRAMGLMYGLSCTLNPFSANPVFTEIELLAPSAQASAMREPGFRERLLANVTGDRDDRIGGAYLSDWGKMYELSDPPDYEPAAANSIAARAERAGCRPEEIAYDILVKDEGGAFIYVPSGNYREGNLDVVKELLEHPHTIPGLSDGGAHVASISDASFPTTLLAHWGRDRVDGRIAVPELIKRQCADTARFVGLADRGVLAPGYRADINVIDFEHLAARRPEIHTDLPGGGRRLMQRADGYLHTIVSGLGVYENGEATGELPGRLVRGAQRAPVATSPTR
jgi:N-acyl-D-aspartate/D-glutamate deacylase